MKRFSEWWGRTADSRSIGILCTVYGIWGVVLGIDIGLHLH